MYFVMFASALLYDILVPKSRVTDAYVKRLYKLRLSYSFLLSGMPLACV